jgi:SM-20-related protein
MQKIEVEITLKGGQSYSGILDSDSTLLHDLYVGLASGISAGPDAPGILMQFPIEDGRAACSFMSTNLVSVLTRPAVLIQQQTEVQSQTSAVVPSHIRIDDFLTPAENRLILKYALDNGENYEGSTVVKEGQKSESEDHRKSKVLFSIKDSNWKELFFERLKLHLPHICATLGIDGTQINDSEIQLTASNDGDFFHVHADADQGNPDLAGRAVTFVYYFHKTPKPFSGGDLLIYETSPGHSSLGGNKVTTIEPVNNSMVIFASHLWHEVDLVRCLSGEFVDSRFTINGWLRRGE